MWWVVRPLNDEAKIEILQKGGDRQKRPRSKKKIWRQYKKVMRRAAKKVEHKPQSFKGYEDSWRQTRAESKVIMREGGGLQGVHEQSREGVLRKQARKARADHAVKCSMTARKEYAEQRSF